VLLSSHLIGELERVCDRVLLLNQGVLELADTTEHIIAAHRILIGPRGETSVENVSGVDIVRRLESDRQVKLWIRGDPGPLAHSWQTYPASLEDIVTAYMADRAGTPTPTRALGLMG
jgi:ABC-2 type transport system ATP-binding protein